MPASDNKAMLAASEARAITANIVRLLDKKCIHLNGRDPAWQTLFTQRSQDLENTTSAVDFERTVNELLTEGGLSHVAFFHETGNRAPARYAINATFARLESDNGVGPRWIFQDVHEGGPAYNAGVRPGDTLLYYAVGQRVVFGAYEATSLPFNADPADAWGWHVKVAPLVDVDFVHDGVPLR